MRKFYAILFLSFLCLMAFSQEGTWTSTQSGAWSADATWGGVTAPVNLVSGDVVTIVNTVTIGLNADVTITSSGTINVNSGGTFTVGGSAGFPPTTHIGVLNSSGIINMNGGIIKTAGDPSSALTISSSGEMIYNSGTINASGITINGTYNHAIDDGILPSGLTWGGSSVLLLSGITTLFPSASTDTYNDLEIDSDLSGDIVDINGIFSKFQDVTITNTGSHSLKTEVGQTTTISGDLDISSNGSLIIGATDQLTVTGALTNSTDANLLIKSTSSGTGSLIFGSGTPEATVERFVSAGNWHLMGPPVASAPASTFLSGYMQRWHEYDGVSQGYWEVIITDPNITRGTGDAFYFIGSSFTGEYNGQLLAANLTMGSLGNTTNDGTDGWHCLANPFASAVTWANCTATNVSAAQKYNGSSYSAVATIPAQQGFFVQVDDGLTGSVTFTQASKAHDAATFYKNDDSPWGESIILKLHDNAGKSNDQLIIRLDDDATFAYESAFDARKIEGNPIAGEFFAQITENDFACMIGIPLTGNTITIPVGFKKGDESEYTIDLSENNFSDNVSINLEDTESGQIINLKEQNAYTFTSNESNNNRFNLLISSATGLDDSDIEPSVHIWNTTNRIYIETSSKESYDIYIYSITGKLIEVFQNNSDETMSYPMNFAKGSYIVKYVSGHNSFSQKIIK